MEENKLEQIGILLKHQGREATSKINGADFLTSSELGRKLFAQAPARFLTRHSSEELVDIVVTCQASLDRFLLSGRASVEHHVLNGQHSLTVVLGDRPFIVNTVTEHFRNRGFAPEIFLHPVLNKGDGWISLHYVEVPELDNAQRDDLVTGLQSALTHLIAVTDDFTPMLARTESIARYLEGEIARSINLRDENVENAAFLRWLMDGAFSFLGYAEGVPEQPTRLTNGLGLLRSVEPELLQELGLDRGSVLGTGAALSISKLRSESPVHHLRRLLHIAITEYTPDKKVKCVHSVVGLLTSKALAEESSGAPLIRRKLRSTLAAEEVLENTHDCRKIASLIDHMPKAEALILESDILRRLARSAISTESLAVAEVIITLDAHNRGVTTIVLLPPDRFNAELGDELARIIERAVGSPPNSCDMHVDVTASSETRLYFSAVSSLRPGKQPNLELLHQQLATACMAWHERLQSLLANRMQPSDAEALAERFFDAFSHSYQTQHTPEQAAEDVLMLATIDAACRLRIAFHEAPPGTAEVSHTLTIYSGNRQFTISDAAPKLENFGMEVIRESSWDVRFPQGERCTVQRFGVRCKTSVRVSPERFQALVEPFISAVLDGRTPSDPLNSLVLTADLSQRQVELLRSYCYLLWQVNTSATRRTLVVTLAATPEFARELWGMFSVRFDPALKLPVPDRSARFHKLLQDFKQRLLGVKEIARDRIYRSLASLIEHTLRTNFFLSEPAIALKLNCEKIEFLPFPRPKYEIFVMSPTVEGVHLRSGSVARGGIRWSDRLDDYRTEVLSLMKTQKIKNVVIVPTGAKGGFVVKQPPADPKEMPSAVIGAYKEFLRAILSITDNRVGDGVQPPAGIVRYDGDDPYLVVAADKGTASFSDTANGIATDEFHFWLRDAFASGGSNGYDHKLYGITARGAWECVRRHFNDLGINYHSSPFTVTGIGDMSGDVFGNGLILSPMMALIAAFNHKHIFIDPTPDVAKAFEERNRLFRERGQWSEYNRALISKGGGIFDRSEKEILITPEIRQALSLGDDFPGAATGEQLITAILTAKVDLLWNGGIGTYVKASYETHQDASDSTNDAVRVNADALRCRVVGEGGNLGFTQRARIEFAERGGRINTDAIDNSGGVDLSDHEVNLKILFAGLLNSKKLSLEERNALLKEMAPEVCEMVLQHNRRHALMLTFAEDRSKRSIDYVRSLIQHLVKLSFLNRTLDALPDEDEIMERAEQGRGMTRPELAVCTAATKMWINDALLKSSLLQEPVLQSALLEYFPTPLRARFKDEIAFHPLGKEIIATQLTSSLVDFLGVTYFHRTASSFNAPVVLVLKCAIASFELIEAERLFSVLQGIDHPASASAFLKWCRVLFEACRATSTWMLGAHRDTPSIENIVRPYKRDFEAMVVGAEAGLSTERRAEFRANTDELVALGLSLADATRLAFLPRALQALEVIRLSRLAGKEVDDVRRVYRKVAELIAVDSMRRSVNELPANGKWEQDLLADALADIESSVSSTSMMLLQRGITSAVEVEEKLCSSDAFVQLRTAIDDLKGKLPSIAAVAVLGRKLREMRI